MSDIEDDYRKALRRYPTKWRRNHEDALIAVLLDTAEAEGRDHMTSAERKDLARIGVRLRVSRAVAAVLSVIALLLLWHTATLVINRVGLDADLIIQLPQTPATADGVIPYLEQPGWAVYITSLVLITATGLPGLLLTLRNRRTDRII